MKVFNAVSASGRRGRSPLHWKDMVERPGFSWYFKLAPNSVNKG